MSCGCEGREPQRVKPPSSTGCGCAGGRPNARRVGSAKIPVSLDSPPEGAEGTPKLDELSALLRNREVYWPPREVLARFDPKARTVPADRCESLPRDALVPRRVLAPEDAGVRRILERKLRQAPKSDPNLLLQVLASLWVLRTVPGVASPEQGIVECGEACASPVRPARSVAECGLQVPPPERSFPFVQEPPQSELVDESGLGDDCPSCGISSLGKNALRTKLGTPQVPYPMCHDPGYRFEDAYTPYVDPRPAEARGKGGEKPLPCPCECRCVVRVRLYDPPPPPRERLPRVPWVPLEEPGGSLFPPMTWPQPPRRPMPTGIYAPPHTYVPPRRSEVVFPLTASGYAAQRGALEQGQWIGAGENSGWEIDLGEYRPPGTFDTASILSQATPLALSAPEHPDSKGSMTFGLSPAMERGEFDWKRFLPEFEARS